MTMLEKIARAISATNTGSEINWPDFTHEAHAAVEAMMEPSDEMLKAASDLKSPCVKYRSAYRAMITEILRERA